MEIIQVPTTTTSVSLVLEWPPAHGQIIHYQDTGNFYQWDAYTPHRIGGDPGMWSPITQEEAGACVCGVKLPVYDMTNPGEFVGHWCSKLDEAAGS